MENEKKSNKGLIGLIVILVIIITVLATIIVMDKLNNNENKTSNDNTNVTENNKKEDKVSDKKEETIKLEDYEYLVNNVIYVDCAYDTDLLKKNYTINTIPEEYMLSAAITASKEEEYKLEEKYAKYFDLSYEELKEYNSEGYLTGISSKNLKDSIKKIFNKDMIIPKKFSANRAVYIYVDELDAYIYQFDGACGPSSFIDYVNFKVEKKGNELYIYSKFYVEERETESGIPELYDYASIKYNSEGNRSDYLSTAIAKVDKNNKINNLEIEEYVKQNLDKFTTYKFIFELKDGNYIYSRFEKQSN